MRFHSHVTGALALYLTTAVLAAPRPLKEVTSADGACTLRLTPGRSSATRSSPCRAFLMVRSDDGRREKCWDRTLVNEVAPEQAFLHPSGAFLVTLNEFQRGGARNALVIYDGSGLLLRHFMLSDLLSDKDWPHAKIEGDAIRWLKDAKMRFDTSRQHFVIELAWGRTIRIDLAHGQIISQAEPPKLPNEFAKLLFPVADEITPQLSVPPASKAVEAAVDVELPAEPNQPSADATTAAATTAEETSDAPLDPTQPPLPDPTHPVDYLDWMNHFVTPQGLPTEPQIESVCERFLKWEGDWSVCKDALDGQPEALCDPALLQWLADNEDAIADFRLAALQFNDGLRYKYGGEPSLFKMELPQLSTVRQLVRATILQGNIKAANGEQDEAAAVYLDTAAAGAQIGRGGTLIESLVGYSVQQLAFQAMLRQAVDDSDGYDPERVVAGLAKMPLELRPFNELIQAEQAMTLDVMQYIFEYDTAAKTYRVNPDRINLLLSDVGGSADQVPAELEEQLALRGFEKSVAEIREHYTTIAAIAELPFPEAERYLTDVERLSEQDDFSPLLKLLTPSYKRYAQFRSRCESQRNGAELALNVLAYRKEHGELPESLSVFGDANFVTDPLTNQQFAYRRDGDQFTLYSYGHDNEDDGGVHNPQGEEDYVIWPPQE